MNQKDIAIQIIYCNAKVTFSVTFNIVKDPLVPEFFICF